MTTLWDDFLDGDAVDKRALAETFGRAACLDLTAYAELDRQVQHWHIGPRNDQIVLRPGHREAIVDAFEFLLRRAREEVRMCKKCDHETASSDKRWRRVRAATPWRPAPDEALVGYYRGRELRQSQENGEYEVAIIEDRAGHTHSVGGVMALQLLRDVRLTPTTLVRLVFEGLVPCGDYQMKSFRLYVEA